MLEGDRIKWPTFVPDPAHTIEPGEIFVFGSNQAGFHGAGAAFTALKEHGATFRVGEGHTGNAYAIPTKDLEIQTLPLPEVKAAVDRFLAYARQHPELRFFVTKIGCGLAGFSEFEISPLFEGAPSNCRLPPDWREPVAGGPDGFRE